MRICLLIIVSIGYLIGVQPCQAQDKGNNLHTRIDQVLKSIVPIESTAEDVKKLIGKPISKSPDFHEFDDFNALVSYTSGLPCEKEPTDGWNVPRNRVITFTIIIKAVLLQKELQKFGIDLSKYEKDVAERVPETIYTNNEEGLRIYLIGDHVTSIALFPAKKYLNLMCLKAKE